MGIIFELGMTLRRKTMGEESGTGTQTNQGQLSVKAACERNANTTFPVVGLFRDQLLSV